MAEVIMIGSLAYFAHNDTVYMVILITNIWASLTCAKGSPYIIYYSIGAQSAWNLCDS